MFRGARENPNDTNNDLHKALLNKNKAIRIDQALKLVASMDEKELNQQSGGNTPLMLALKTANLVVAKALLERPDVKACPRWPGNTGTYDDRLLTPLHLALAWRDTDIIKLILKKYAEALKGALFDDQATPTQLHECLTIPDYEDLTPFLTTFALKTDAHWPVAFRNDDLQFNARNPNYARLADRTLLNIYKNPYDLEKITKDAKGRGFIPKSEHKEEPVIAEHLNEPLTNYLMFAPELTDALLFHSNLIAMNLELDISSDELQYGHNSRAYVHNLELVLPKAIEYRNAKTADPDVTAMLDKDTKELSEEFFTSIESKPVDTKRL